MINIHMFPLVALLLIFNGSKILAQGMPPPDVSDEFQKIGDSDPKADLVSENDVDGLLKYAGVFGGNENDYPQVIAPYDSSLQAHIRVKRFRE
ncbi:unnamed protein product [Nezara viridula]|uniref:Neuropeptide n=1 Tax=Nezara viridula TaxID=85310 RepID=A0A9P0E7F4_NEZVI|nr:unnamed protein product [Nezara viridula]